MNRKLRVGIVGANRGQSYLLAFQGRAEIAALCDLDPRCLEQTANQAGVPLRYTNYEDMLDKARLDLVVVSTPMPFHAPQSIAALERGIHVLSEVPAATDLEQCWQLVQAARSSRAKYMMAENCCFMKDSVLVRAMAHAGVFGELYYGEGGYVHEIRDRHELTPWRRFWQTGIRGGTYITHPLGPLLQWQRARVVSVTCMGTGNRATDREGNLFVLDDSTTVLCKLNTGGMVVVRLDLLSLRPPNLPWYSLSLQGTKGCYEAPRSDGEKHRVWIEGRCPDKEEWHSLWDFADEFLPAEWRNPPAAAKEAGHDSSDYFVAQEFLDSIQRDRKPMIDVYDALDMTLPGLISQESIRRGGVPLPVPDFRAIRNFPDDLPAELQNSWVMRVRQQDAS